MGRVDESMMLYIHLTAWCLREMLQQLFRHVIPTFFRFDWVSPDSFVGRHDLSDADHGMSRRSQHSSLFTGIQTEEKRSEGSSFRGMGYALHALGYRLFDTQASLSFLKSYFFPSFASVRIHQRYGQSNVIICRTCPFPVKVRNHKDSPLLVASSSKVVSTLRDAILT